MKPKIRLRNPRLTAVFVPDPDGFGRYLRSEYFIDLPREGRLPWRVVIAVKRDA